VVENGHTEDGRDAADVSDPHFDHLERDPDAVAA
jgi:hypothetical protein